MRPFEPLSSVVGAHAGDHGVVLCEIAALEIGIAQQGDVVAHLPQRVGHLVAGAHDVADAQSAFLHIDAHGLGRCVAEHALRRDVRIIDGSNRL